MPKKPFKPGNEFARQGGLAKRGCGEKRWMRPEYWHDLVMKEWPHLEPEQRATIAMKGFAVVMPKVIGPQSVEESVQNAQAAMKMLKMLQDIARDGTHAGISAGGDPVSVGAGRPETQAIEAPAPGL
jgi:hypothetical protein